ncbi:hypothetical protein RI367_006384 [Sorochytrium milnesiophthora]
MDRLPDEALLHLLHFCTTRSLGKLEATSRRFRRLLKDNTFWFRYQQHNRPRLARFAKYQSRVNYRTLHRNNHLFESGLQHPQNIGFHWIRPKLAAEERVEIIERTIPLFDDTFFAFPSVVVRNPNNDDFQPLYRVEVCDLRNLPTNTITAAETQATRGSTAPVLIVRSHYDGDSSLPRYTLDIPMSTTVEDAGVRQINSHHLVLNIDAQTRLVAVATWLFHLSGENCCNVDMFQFDVNGQFTRTQQVQFPAGVLQIQLYFRSQLPKLFEMLDIQDDYCMWYFRLNEDLMREQMNRLDYSVPDLRDLWLYCPTRGHYQRCMFPAALEGVIDLCFVPYIFKRAMVSLHHQPAETATGFMYQTVDDPDEVGAYRIQDAQPTLKMWDFFNGQMMRDFSLPPASYQSLTLDHTSHIIPREEMGTWLLITRSALAQPQIPGLAPMGISVGAPLAAAALATAVATLPTPTLSAPVAEPSEEEKAAAPAANVPWSYVQSLINLINTPPQELNNIEQPAPPDHTEDDGADDDDAVEVPHNHHHSPQLRSRDLLVTFYNYQVSANTAVRYRTLVRLPPALATCQYETYLFALHCDGRLCVYSMEHLVDFGLAQDDPTPASHPPTCLVMRVSPALLGSVDEEAFMSCFRTQDGNVWLVACLGHRMLAIDFQLPYKIPGERRKEACLDDALFAS